ncbi:MAG: A24 family peptidase [Elusimicrobiota bacterium]|jgi:prepilin signal peptidase PulO-like enzyme (type II secretory pathway)|nr:A24 family peptidase [Elusimicrobiota bacterium]
MVTNIYNLTIYFFIILLLFFLSILSVFFVENAKKDGKNLKLDFFSFKFIKLCPLFCDIYYLISVKNRLIKKFSIKKLFVFLLIFFINVFIFYVLFRFEFFYKFSSNLFLHFFIIYFLFLASIIDIKYRIIPNFIFYILLLLATLFSINNSVFFVNLLGAIISLIISLFVYYLGFFIFKEDALGFGDVKVFCCIGLLFGIKGFLLVFFYAFFISAIFGLILKITYFFKNKYKKNNNNLKKIYLPFIPFIFIATILALYFENYIVIFK